jgi:MFS family permease
VAPDRAALQRHTVSTLVVSQAVGALGITIGIATASLLARDLSGSDQEAGLAQTFQVLGTALFSWLLARMMARRGRRIGLTAGYLVGAAGAGLAVLSGVVGSMLVLLVGATLLGANSSANYAARYAATDLATEDTRGRALSVVVWATTVGAVLGPNLTGPSARLAEGLGIPELTGPFALGSLGMVLAALVIWVRLRPDPLLVARDLAAAPAPEEQRDVEQAPLVEQPAVETAVQVEEHPPPVRQAAAPAEPTTVREALRARPALLAAIVGMAAAHAVMVSVMVMTPLHMEHGGAELRVIGFVISVHVLGMFAFSPLVGWAVDRFGRAQVLGAGAAVLLLSLLISGRSPMGSSVEIFLGLFLLGLGWSMATVAAATVVAAEAPLSVRTEVQGTADLVMSLAAAAGGAASGVVVHLGSFAWLNLFAALFGALVIAAAVAASPVRAWGHLAGKPGTGRPEFRPQRGKFPGRPGNLSASCKSSPLPPRHEDDQRLGFRRRIGSAIQGATHVVARTAPRRRSRSGHLRTHRGGHPSRHGGARWQAGTTGRPLHGHPDPVLQRLPREPRAPVRVVGPGGRRPRDRPGDRHAGQRERGRRRR